MKNLNPVQRIEANRAKLIMHGVIEENTPWADILSLDASSYRSGLAQYINEIRKLLGIINADVDGGSILPGEFELSPNGVLRFFSDKERLALQRLVSDEHLKWDALQQK